MSRASMQFDLGFSRPQDARRRDDTDPFRILLLGRLGGSIASPFAQRKPIRVDIDNFERVFERLAPRLELEIDGAPLTIELRSLDDFHPDRLYERLEPFRALRQLRAELKDPAQFGRAAVALGAAPEAPAAADVSEESAADIERLLGRKPVAPTAATASGGVDISGLLRDIVAPHVVPDIAQEQQRLLAALDAVIAERICRVLHDPAFQALEALWRGVERLVRGLELGENLQLFLFDVSREELAQDIRTHAGDLSQSALHGHLCGPQTQPPDGKRWSLLVADLSFGADMDALQLLAALGAMAGRAGAPLLAAASPSLLGCDGVERLVDPRTWQPLDAETATYWGALRQSPFAPWIGLALPRVLGRLPYGKDSDPIAEFDFEELAVREHEAYLWGSPALALALLAGQVFTESGWDMDLGAGLDIGDLPSHIYREEGEACQQPCAEVAMGESAGEAVLRQGLMPLLSYRNRDLVRLLRFQSIADPARPLLGAWVDAAGG